MNINAEDLPLDVININKSLAFGLRSVTDESGEPYIVLSRVDLNAQDIKYSEDNTEYELTSATIDGKLNVAFFDFGDPNIDEIEREFFDKNALALNQLNGQPITSGLYVPEGQNNALFSANSYALFAANWFVEVSAKPNDWIQFVVKDLRSLICPPETKATAVAIETTPEEKASVTEVPKTSASDRVTVGTEQSQTFEISGKTQTLRTSEKSTTKEVISKEPTFVTIESKVTSATTASNKPSQVATTKAITKTTTKAVTRATNSTRPSSGDKLNDGISNSMMLLMIGITLLLLIALIVIAWFLCVQFQSKVKQKSPMRPKAKKSADKQSVGLDPPKEQSAKDVPRQESDFFEPQSANDYSKPISAPNTRLNDESVTHIGKPTDIKMN